MIGYKAFDKDLKCRGFQFEVGQVYEKENGDEKHKLCIDTVFHFCRELHHIEAVSNYVIADSRVCEVIAEGAIVTDGDKYGTDKLRILREIPKEELQKYNNCNSGNWNSGYCNTNKPLVRIFNKNTKIKRDELEFPSFMYFNLTVWVSHDTATEQEKEKHKKEIEVCGGFLKTLQYKEAFKLAYEKAKQEEHYQLFALPNFSPKIFKEISGIDTRAEYKQWKLEQRK